MTRANHSARPCRSSPGTHSGGLFCFFFFFFFFFGCFFAFWYQDFLFWAVGKLKIVKVLEHFSGLADFQCPFCCFCLHPTQHPAIIGSWQRKQPAEMLLRAARPVVQGQARTGWKATTALPHNSQAKGKRRGRCKGGTQQPPQQHKPQRQITEPECTAMHRQ